MKDKNWINEMSVYFYGNDIEKWEKICKDAEEGKVPSVTIRGVEYALVRHSKWVIEPDATIMHCNSCGWAYEYYAGLEEEWNFCPHCGAKMDQEESDEADISGND